MWPVAISSSPNSSKMTVPLALLLPMHLCPVCLSSSAISSGGKPVSVNVLNGTVVRKPIISQCPVIVSLAQLASRSVVYRASGCSTGATCLSGCRFARPSFCKFGMVNRSTDAEICPKVSVPASPYCAASSIAPAPSESNTTTKMRRYFFISSSPFLLSCILIDSIIRCLEQFLQSYLPCARTSR